MVAATEPHRQVATDFLARICARGGTELLAPLENGAAALAEAPPGTFDSEGFVTREAAARPRRHRVLVLVTDGQIWREDSVIGALGQQLQVRRYLRLRSVLVFVFRRILVVVFRNASY